MGTNDFPSEFDTAQIKAELASLHQKLAASDEEVERLQRQLQTLKANRLATQGKIHSLKSILSPIKKVPREVMSTILECCLSRFEPETFRDEFRLGPGDAMKSPLIISHVSRGWRDLALSLPNLWSNVEAYVTQNPLMGISACIRAAEKQADMVTHWVERSKSRQLAWKVKIEAREDALLACQNAIRQILDLLAAQSNRWRSITLSFPGDMNIAHISPILESIQSDHAYLRFLKIHRGGSRRDSGILEQENPLILLGNAPMLAGLHLHRMRFSQSGVPWNQLTDLSIMVGSHDIDQSINAISKCNNLQNLSLSVAFPLPNSTTITTLPKLQMLTVCGQPPALDSLLKSFAVPQLRTLLIKVSGFRDTMVELSPFLGRLSNPLDALELDMYNIDPITLAQWLRLVPSLTRLSFGTQSYFTDEMSHSLLPNGDKEYICPSLTHLRAHFRCSLSTLANMIERRWSLHPTRRSPKCLFVDFASNLSGEDGERYVGKEALVSRFRLLCKEGLQLIT